MNKTFFKLAFGAVLCSTTVGCQKDYLPWDAPEVIATDNSAYTVEYSVNDVSFTSFLKTAEEYHALMLHLMKLSREGNKIVVSANKNAHDILETKDVGTFKTPSSEEAAAWTEKMTKKGFIVYVTYNSEKKIHICVAVNPNNQ